MSQERKGKRENQDGMALLTVLVAMLILTIMVMELQYNAMVERKLAYNQLNQLQAYYLAKSGVRIGLLRLVIYERAKTAPQLQNLGGGVQIGPYLDMIWNLRLPPFPPASDSLGKLTKQDKDAAEKVLKETQVSIGQSSHVITSESSKINLNYLQLPDDQRVTPMEFNTGQPPANLMQFVATELYNLMQGFITQSTDANSEWPDLKPANIVYNIMDWVTPGNTSVMGGPKDRFYEQQNPPYKAKRGRFFTIDELRMVKGINDHLYEKLKPYITVSSYDGKININDAGNDVLRAIYPELTDDDFKRLAEEKARIGGEWPDTTTFVNFITGTLGHSDFNTLYKDKNNYPFTVNNRSFLLESLGVVNKGKTSIQKMIRVAVAMAPPKGGQFDNSILDQQTCSSTAGHFWYKYFQRCAVIPTDQAECTNAGATWMRNPQNNQMCCYFNTEGYQCPPQTADQVQPNTLKILSWTEN